jgi:hypothetical protein
MIAQPNFAVLPQNPTTCSCCHIEPPTGSLPLNNSQLYCLWVQIALLASVKVVEIGRSPVSHKPNMVETSDLSTAALWQSLNHQLKSSSNIISRIGEIALLAIKNVEIPSSCDVSNKGSSSRENEIEDFPLGRFMRFLKHLKIRVVLTQVTDPREPEKTKHQIELILQWVLTVFFFRCKSANALQTAFDKLPQHKRAVLWRFFGLNEGDILPHRTVVTAALSAIDPDEMNDILEKLFKWAMKSKVFYNHMGILLPDSLHAILPMIKEKFPKLPIRLLADSLYANEPLHKLCKELGWEYLLVRQVGSLKNIAKQCDDLGTTDLYKRSYKAKQITRLKNGNRIEQTIKWFNRVT